MFEQIRKPYTYTRKNGISDQCSYVTEILTEEELEEKEKQKLQINEPRDPTLFVYIKKKPGGYMIIESVDSELYIETGWNGRGINNFFKYRDNKLYIVGELCSTNYARLPWTYREEFILKVCAIYDISAETITDILMRSTRNIMTKAKILGLNIRKFEEHNPRSEGILKYREKIQEMADRGYRFQRTKNYLPFYRKGAKYPLRGTERIPFKGLGYFYRGNYNNPYFNN